MARVVPFCGIRYNPEKIGNMDDVVTPPYDVIDDQSQAAFFKKNPYNMIKLDLSKNYNTDALTEERYKEARATFDQWQEEQALIRDPAASYYLYETQYRVPSGARFTRKGFIALVGLAEFDEGIVKPHERTFAGVTSDRLKLMEACEAHFSPIFSLYSDPEGAVLSCLESARTPEPLCAVHDQDGCLHSIWQITDAEVLAKVQALFAGKNLYIADGHHRYTTSLQFRELMRKKNGEVAENSAFNHTMMYLTAMEDPGLSVLPTHRLIQLPTSESVDALVNNMQEYFHVEAVSGGSREVLVGEALSTMQECSTGTCFGFYHAGSDSCYLLRLRDGVMDRLFADELPEALRSLDVVVLSELLFDKGLGIGHDRLEKEKLIRYFADPDEALDVAVKACAADRNGTPLLFLMNGTPVEQVRQVADEGLIMPHKSTYFYPKVLTGLLMNKMVQGEKIS